MKTKAPPIHLAKCFSFAAIHAHCGAAMQAQDPGFSSTIHYWGKVGKRRHPPIALLTFDPELVTCKKCLSKKKD